MLIVLEDSLKNGDSSFVGDSRDRSLVSRSLTALYLLLLEGVEVFVLLIPRRLDNIL